MTYTIRETCRLCEGPLRDVVSLGEIHLSTFLDTNENPPPKVPLDLVQCTKCELILLRHTVNGDIMYSQYWYQSGLNKFMVDALKDVVTETLARVRIEPGDVLIDIGSNDGTLLDQYPKDMLAWFVGFEPSNLHALSHGRGHIIIHDYFNASAYMKIFAQKAKIITSIAMFYDLENPHTFIEDARAILANDGVWTIQLMDLLSMIATRDFPNMCHEHLEYYTLKDMVNLMDQHGLQVFDVSYNDVNGKSLRVYVSHKGARPIELSVLSALEQEREFFESVGDVATYFKKAVEDVRAGVVSFIKYAKSSGQKVAVMGASTKGNTTLQYFGLTEQDIDHAAEINPDKFGKRTVGSNIPIISEETSLVLNPDYYLILPWSFLSSFISRNIDYLKAGGQFIVPLPDPRIVSYKDGELHEWRI